MEHSTVYATNGNTAVDIDVPRYSNENENIIEFPGNPYRPARITEECELIVLDEASTTVENASALRIDGVRTMFEKSCHRLIKRALNSPFAQQIQYGSAKGIAFNRFCKKGAFATGSVFSLIALGTIFIAL